MAPVLYVKPRNTLAQSGDEVVVPRDVEALEIGGCLGLVIDRVATNLGVKAALDYLAGYVIMNDISVPHDSYYRPSIRFKARDGFCPIGPALTPPTRINDPGSLVVRTFIDGKLESASSLTGLIRPIPQLLADVTEFMTLEAGDVLGVGVAAPAPRAHAGQVVSIEIDGLGAIKNRLVPELAAP
jgi:5-oxopent-3-ene-1,2,5-tricarboxylate decarboxylase/2-hydroxyhepta-2,4-diene-1,7-dioate isomerase